MLCGRTFSSSREAHRVVLQPTSLLDPLRLPPRKRPCVCRPNGSVSTCPMELEHCTLRPQCTTATSSLCRRRPPAVGLVLGHGRTLVASRAELQRMAQAATDGADVLRAAAAPQRKHILLRGPDVHLSAPLCTWPPLLRIPVWYVCAGGGWWGGRVAWKRSESTTPQISSAGTTNCPPTAARITDSQYRAASPCGRAARQFSERVQQSPFHLIASPPLYVCYHRN